MRSCFSHRTRVKYVRYEYILYETYIIINKLWVFRETNKITETTRYHNNDTIMLSLSIYDVRAEQKEKHKEKRFSTSMSVAFVHHPGEDNSRMRHRLVRHFSFRVHGDMSLQMGYLVPNV